MVSVSTSQESSAASQFHPERGPLALPEEQCWEHSGALLPIFLVRRNEELPLTSLGKVGSVLCNGLCTSRVAVLRAQGLGWKKIAAEA